MSKETMVFILGAIILLTPFLGVPSDYKEWTFIVCGVLLMGVGYRLRRNAFLKSIEHESGERRGGAFVESDVTESEVTPPHKDTERVI